MHAPCAAGVWLGLVSLVGLNGLGDAVRLLLPGSPLSDASSDSSLVHMVSWRKGVMPRFLRRRQADSRS